MDGLKSAKRAPRISTIVEQEALSNYYKLGETVGKGGFGKVKLAKHVLTGQTVAIKILDKQALGDEYPRALQEISIMKDLQHPRICQLYQVVDKEDKLYLILEHCSNGELFDYIFNKKSDALEETEARRIFRQIVSAVAYMHQKGCIHRDLKPENLLLDKDQNIKLIDFGLAARPPKGMQSLLQTCCGSPCYVAPEVISQQQYLGAPADIWSLGILLHVLLVGDLPFRDDNVERLYQKIMKGSFSTPSYLSANSKCLLKEMLTTSPEARITMDKLLSHPWVMGAYTMSVRWDFSESKNSVDMDVLGQMSGVSPHQIGQMTESIVKRKFDYIFATYLILKNRKRQGLQTYFNIRSMEDVEFFLGHCADTLSLENTVSPEKATEFLNVSFDEPEDDPEYKSPLKQFVPNPLPKEQKTAAVRENRSKMTPLEFKFAIPATPVKKVETKTTQAKSLANGLNQVQSDNTRQIGSKCKAMDDGSDNLLTPLLPPPKLMKSSGKGGMRKFVGSVEKGFNRVVDFLTPSKSDGNSMTVIRTTDVTNNVTFVNSKDPYAVLEEIKAALAFCGFKWKNKKNRAFIIRAHKNSPTGNILLRMSLEVCWISDKETCGIRRERLEGDSLDYRKHFAQLHSEILRLANTVKKDDAALDSPRQRLDFSIK